MTATPILLPGFLGIDRRGVLSAISGIDLRLKRLYWVSNHRAGYIRAWHGHEHEGKLLTVVQGAALIGIVPLEEGPALGTHPITYVVGAWEPKGIFIPGGLAHGWQALKDDTILLVGSTFSVEESEKDDFRWPADAIDIWEDI